MEITTIGVIGAGQMGAGIAHVAALSGYNVVLTDISEERLTNGVAGIAANMNRSISRLGKNCPKVKFFKRNMMNRSPKQKYKSKMPWLASQLL